MRANKINNRLSDIICGLFLLLFTYAAFVKLFAITQFEYALQDFPLIKPFANVTAHIIPPLELGIAILLLIPQTVLKGIWAGVIILFVFTGYILYMIYTNLNIPCSCGGIIQQLSWKQHILFNAFFIILGITYMHIRKQKLKINSFPK